MLRQRFNRLVVQSLPLANKIDFLIDKIGNFLIYLVPFVVLIGGIVVILRYGFMTGFPWLSESFVWLNGIIFLVGAPFLLLHEKHVRIDIIYARLSPQNKNKVDLWGVLILLWPTMLVIGVKSWPTALRSLLSLESSPTQGGLPLIYILKMSVPLFCVLISLQGLSIVIRALQPEASSNNSNKNTVTAKK